MLSDLPAEINERNDVAGIAAARAETGPDQSSRPALPSAPGRSTYPGGGAPSARPLSTLAALGTVGLVLGVSAIVGRRNAPDPSHPGIRRWYRRLDKPGYTPPDAAFGAVWPVLQTGLAVGGYRLLRRPWGTKRNAAIGLWLLNTAMVGGWTQLFFRKKRLGASAAMSGAMVAIGAAYVAAAATVDRLAAAAAVPFVAWLDFATLLAERIWRDNPADSDEVGHGMARRLPEHRRRRASPCPDHDRPACAADLRQPVPANAGGDGRAR